MNSHIFEVRAQYKGGLAGEGTLTAKGLESAFSAPAELKGSGVGTNPEELLASAAGACFLISLAAVLQFQGITANGFQLRTEVEAETEGGLKVTKLRHFPVVTVEKGTATETKAKIEKAIQRAEQICMIGQALRGNVAIAVTPVIEEA